MRRLVMVGLTIAVTACGSGGGATRTTTKPGSTVRQVASAVAQYQPAIEEAVTFEDECNSIECISAEGTVNRIRAAADRADEFHLDLWDLKPYPAEVRALTGRTVRELTRMRDRSDALDACLVKTGGILHGDAIPGISAERPGCEAPLEAAQSTYLDDLPKVMRAWAPYL